VLRRAVVEFGSQSSHRPRKGISPVPDDECRDLRRANSSVRRHHLSGPSLQVTSAPGLISFSSASRHRLAHNQNVNPRELANSICATLQQHGYQALMVGGCVRDLLLHRDPADYDVTTDAAPAQVMELFP